jgi:hypothetical protein
VITIHINADPTAGLDGFDVQLPEAQFEHLEEIAEQHGWTVEETIAKALDRFFDQHWPAGVPRPSKAAAHVPPSKDVPHEG